MSPDESQIAVGRDGDIWLVDASRGTEQRFTFQGGNFPLWSPDGTSIVFGSQGDLFQQAVAGTRSPELLLETANFKLPYSWSADGEWLSYAEQSGDTLFDVWLLPMSEDRTPISFLQTPFFEGASALSPDGRLMAYATNESGGFQVYVQRVPSGGGLWAVSTNGGSNPQWRGDGRELYYAWQGSLMAVDIEENGENLEVGIPHQLFEVPFRQTPVPRNVFDVTADGERFLVNTLVDGALAAPITWVHNWTMELEQ